MVPKMITRLQSKCLFISLELTVNEEPRIITLSPPFVVISNMCIVYILVHVPKRNESLHTYLYNGPASDSSSEFWSSGLFITGKA